MKNITQTSNLLDDVFQVKRMQVRVIGTHVTFAYIHTYIHTSLCWKVDKLMRIRRLLTRLEFLSELPERLSEMIDKKNYQVQLYVCMYICMYVCMYGIYQPGFLMYVRMFASMYVYSCICIKGRMPV